MRFSEIHESAPPGMEKWIKDRKADFKKRYGDRWQEVLYATAWKQKNNESVEQGVAEAGYGRGYSSYHDQLRGQERDEQNYMDQSKRDFKRREMEHELAGEEEYWKQREQTEKFGTWYIRINGKLLKDRQGQPYTFRGKAAANKAALTMMAKPFNQGKEFRLTTSATDKAPE